ncbi:16025_t:CDS:2, partial [Funneliformis geosporum]
MVLVNGSEGIGTGLRSYITNYNPQEIVDNLKRLINNEETVQGTVGSCLPSHTKVSKTSSSLGTNMCHVPVEHKRRFMIKKKIVLNNFKSYIGQVEIGPFHKSFSATVGPNGSGKSNFIDAFFFVFGYRASIMRQGKLSGLIHSSQGCENLDA